MQPTPFHVAAGADTVGATHYPSADAAKAHALLVLAHGAGAGQQSPFMVGYAAALARRGLDVVTFDFPYMARGRKTPDRTPVLEAAFRAAVRAAVAHTGLGAAHLVIGGKSMGGRIATHLAAAPADWPNDLPRVSGVVALGYPLAPPGGRRAGDRVTHLRHLAVPALIVQGTRDPFGGPDEVQDAVFAAGAHPPVEVLRVDGGDHSFGVLKSSGRDPAEMHDAVQDAIARWVADLRARA